MTWYTDGIVALCPVENETVASWLEVDYGPFEGDQADQRCGKWLTNISSTEQLVATVTYVATVLFNDGKTQWLDIMSDLSIECGPRAVEMCKRQGSSQIREYRRTSRNIRDKDCQGKVTYLMPLREIRIVEFPPIGLLTWILEFLHRVRKLGFWSRGFFDAQSWKLQNLGFSKVSSL